MNDKQQFKMMMSILINNDARVAYHTYSLQEGKKEIYEHNEKFCLRCQALWIIEKW